MMEIVERSSGYWIVDAQGVIEGAFIELSEAEERLTEIMAHKDPIYLGNSGTELKIGDRVKVIDQNITGEIVRMDGVKAVVLDDDCADWMEEDEDGTLIFRMSSLKKIPITITVTLKDDFDPTLGADIVEAVEDFEQVLASYF